MEQGHSELHRMINVLVQNSIEWHIAHEGGSLNDKSVWS